MALEKVVPVLTLNVVMMQVNMYCIPQAQVQSPGPGPSPIFYPNLCIPVGNSLTVTMRSRTGLVLELGNVVAPTSTVITLCVSHFVL